MDKNIKTDNSEDIAEEKNISSDTELTAEAEPAAVAETDSAFEAEIAVKKKSKGASTIFTVFLFCLIAVFLFVMVFMNLFILCPVSQTSMLPYIADGQRVLLLKTKNIGRGDVFVFKTEEIDQKTGENKNLIKRAVAIGGDRLVFVAFGEPGHDSEVYIYLDTGDGFVFLQEDYLNKDNSYGKPMIYGKMGGSRWLVYFSTADAPEAFDVNQAEKDGLLENKIIEIAKDTCYAMGDNRNVSEDSRTIGSINKEDIIGRCSARLVPGSFIETIMKLIYRESCAD